MSSALIQINGDGGFFRPGVIRCNVVAPTAHHHNHRSAHAINALREQVWPYMTGEPWKFARGAMVQWQGSHMEDDVRKAAAETLGKLEPAALEALGEEVRTKVRKFLGTPDEPASVT